MGLGFQLIHWDPEFCRRLADQGFYVIRFDNRDVGLSTKIHGGAQAQVARRVRRQHELGLLHAVGHGRRHGRAARPPGAARRPRGRDLDGRDDRPVPGHQAPRPRPLARLSALHHRQPAGGLPRMRALALLLKRAPEEREAYSTSRSRSPRSSARASTWTRDACARSRPPPTTAATTRWGCCVSWWASRPRATAPSSSSGWTCPPWSSTAPTTRWCPPARATPPRRRSRAPAWSRSPTWRTTCRPRSGTR